MSSSVKLGVSLLSSLDDGGDGSKELLIPGVSEKGSFSGITS